jgi:hypothetical protein
VRTSQKVRDFDQIDPDLCTRTLRTHKDRTRNPGKTTVFQMVNSLHLLPEESARSQVFFTIRIPGWERTVPAVLKISLPVFGM